MGREVRRVPADWSHPKNAEGHYIPLHGTSYAQRMTEWETGYAKWQQGYRESWKDPSGWQLRSADEQYPYEEWAGDRPTPEDYMPDWPDMQRTHYQMYEDTTEGTPISPVMETPEALAQWLVDNNASAFADETASYQAWLAICRGGWAPSAVYTPQTGLISGVEYEEYRRE